MITGQRPDEPSFGLLFEATNGGTNITGVILGHNTAADLSAPVPVLLPNGWWKNLDITYKQETPETSEFYGRYRSRRTAAAGVLLKQREKTQQDLSEAVVQAHKVAKKLKAPRAKSKLKALRAELKLANKQQFCLSHFNKLT